MVNQIKKINGFAKKGYEVAFSKKSNAIKYRKLLKQSGYNSATIRSSGPTIEGTKYKGNSYYIIPEKKKRIIRIVKKRRINSQPQNIFAMRF